MIKTKNRLIKTRIPNPATKKILRELDKYESQSTHSHQLPIVWDRADGFNVWDKWGNKFIDFTSCIFVTNSGHSNPDVSRAIYEQVTKPLLHSYTFPTQERIDFLKKLSEFTGYEKAFLLSAGTEATEAAVKIMRAYTKRDVIVSFKGSMHGKTALAWGLRGENDTLDVFQNIHLPFPTQGFEHWDDWIDDIDVPPTTIAGFMIESYRGWDAQPFPQCYIQELVKWARKKKILICFDEIQAGFGRTGKKFFYEYYEVRPDLVCLGKGLGGGVPISAVVGGKKLLDTPNDLSSTNSANPLVCSVALANLKYIESHHLVEESSRKGRYILAYIENIWMKYPRIIERVNFMGLVGAIVFNSTETADKVCFGCMEKGLLLVRTGRESVKLAPPLMITDEALKEGINVLEEVINEVDKAHRNSSRRPRKS